MESPKLKTVSKVYAPYLFNNFPSSFVDALGLEIILMLATSRNPSLEGPEWERMFAKAIDAEWKPSNVGLDDVVKGSFAWGAKTVKCLKPHETSSVRLISGRNNPEYSFGAIADSEAGIGSQVIQIWNGRVESLRDRFKELRTVVLLKPTSFDHDKIPFSVFEFETVRYPEDRYDWRRNKNGNLQGYSTRTDEHKFTWQRHGSQFTIIESVPVNRLKFFVKKPTQLSQDEVLRLVGYDKTWIEVV